MVVVNKCDMFHTEDEEQEVLDYVRSNLEEILPGNDIMIYAVSARQALVGKIQSAYEDKNWKDTWSRSKIGSQNFFFQAYLVVLKLFPVTSKHLFRGC